MQCTHGTLACLQLAQQGAGVSLHTLRAEVTLPSAPRLTLQLLLDIYIGPRCLLGTQEVKVRGFIKVQEGKATQSAQHPRVPTLPASPKKSHQREKGGTNAPAISQGALKGRSLPAWAARQAWSAQVCLGEGLRHRLLPKSSCREGPLMATGQAGCGLPRPPLRESLWTLGRGRLHPDWDSKLDLI